LTLDTASNHLFHRPFNLIQFGNVSKEPLLEFPEASIAIKKHKDRVATIINVVDLIFHDLNIRVLNQALDFVDSDTSENVESQ
jgi:hypothetical protein